MLRIRVNDGSFLFFVDDENVRRLTSGQPIAIDLRPMGGVDRLIIAHKPTVVQAIEELREINGGELPPIAPFNETPPTQ